MLLLRLTGPATLALLSLAGWERERLADAMLLLTTDPRPPFATRRSDLPGEALEIWLGERRILYRVYKDDEEEDYIVMVTDVI